MKTILTLFLCLVSFFAQGQIKNNFWGLKIGESTMKQVSSVVKDKKLRFRIFPEAVAVLGSIEFAGERWNGLTFHFINNKLFAVVFALESQHSNEETFLTLAETLIEKYEKDLDDFDMNKVETYIQFLDENNILLKLSYNKNTDVVNLGYSDMELLEEYRLNLRDNDL